jgi:hypothetical protein
MAPNRIEINEAFRLCYRGAQLEEQALTAPLDEASKSRRLAAENYSKAVELLLHQKAQGTSAITLREIVQCLVERLESIMGLTGAEFNKKPTPLKTVRDPLKG